MGCRREDSTEPARRTSLFSSAPSSKCGSRVTFGMRRGEIRIGSRTRAHSRGGEARRRFMPGRDQRVLSLGDTAPNAGGALRCFVAGLKGRGGLDDDPSSPVRPRARCPPGMPRFAPVGNRPVGRLFICGWFAKPIRPGEIPADTRVEGPRDEARALASGRRVRAHPTA
jgi:hypothetical protein